MSSSSSTRLSGATRSLILVSSMLVVSANAAATGCPTEDLVWYSNLPCSPSCDNREPVCAAVVIEGFGCPASCPVILPDNSCGTFDDCNDTTAESVRPGECEAIKHPRPCRRHQGCRWRRTHEDCVHVKG